MLKYDVICKCQKCYAPSNLERHKREIMWKIVSETWKHGSRDVKSNDAKMHVMSLCIITSEIKVKHSKKLLNYLLYVI